MASRRSLSYGQPDRQISITELIVAFLEHAKVYYGEDSGEYKNLRHALRSVRQSYGKQPASAFGPLQLKAVRESFIAADNARKYINQQIRRIRHVFRWCSEGLIPVELPQALGMVDGLRRGHTTARETKRVSPVDDAMINATLPHPPPVVCSMVELQRVTGMRPGELCILRPGDIQRTADVSSYRPERHKTQTVNKRGAYLSAPKVRPSCGLIYCERLMHIVFRRQRPSRNSGPYGRKQGRRRYHVAIVPAPTFRKNRDARQVNATQRNRITMPYDGHAIKHFQSRRRLSMIQTQWRNGKQSTAGLLTKCDIRRRHRFVRSTASKGLKSRSDIVRRMLPNSMQIATTLSQLK